MVLVQVLISLAKVCTHLKHVHARDGSKQSNEVKIWKHECVKFFSKGLKPRRSDRNVNMKDLDLMEEEPLMYFLVSDWVE